MSQKWIIKDSLDQVSGPFETAEVIRQIHQGLITEADYLASYPEGKWIVVTKNQIFFDEMLASISRSSDKATTTKKTEKSSIAKVSIDKTEALSKTHKLENTKPIKDSQLEDAGDKTDRIDVSQIQEKDKVSDDEFFEPTALRKNLPKSSGQLPQQIFSQREMLDLKKHKPQTFIDKKRNELSLTILFVSFIAATWFFWPMSENQIKGDNFKLRAPRFDKNPISKMDESKNLKLAFEKIRKGSFNNFREAHNDLIKVLESQSQNIDALSLLCFTNYHLWEFTQKTSKDLFAISIITKKAMEIDRFGEKGRVCRFVDLAVRGNYGEAQTVVDDVLDSEQGSTSVIFSYFNGLLKFSKKEYIAAESYLSAAITRSLKQNYAVMWVALSEANTKLGKANLAYNSALKAIIINPDYVDALLIKGIIQYRNQKKSKAAKATLQNAFLLLSKDKANKKRLSDAYVVLAEIALFERRRKDALQYAIAAYNYNPGNSVAKNLAIELGGNRKVGKINVISQQMVIEGEQNLQESGCASAQVMFKQAYKLDPKNGYAAFKTAQCLWDLSFSTDAIEWIERAIQADPSLSEAYVTAAYFYMQRYDFDASLQVLLRAAKAFPRSYEVFRGLAQLELKKQNPQLAIEYAKRALKIYDADTDTLIVMTKAYSELNQMQEAFQYIVRASENDSRNVEVHTMYGKLIYKIQGIFASQEYLKNRIASYPQESAYRVTLAEIYLEDQKFREAELVAREAIEYDDKAKAAYLVVGKALKARDDKKNALTYFLDAYSLDPSDAEPLFEAGQLYIDIQKYDEAIKQFERVLKISPQYPAIHYNIAKVYFAQRKMNEALSACKVEIENYPEREECYVLSAEAYFYMGSQEKDKISSAPKVNVNEVDKIDKDRSVNYNKMIQYYKLCADSYQKAIDISRQSASVYIDLSRCYRFAGEFDMSQKMVEKALEVEKGNPIVWRENGLLFEQKGEYALALEAYKQYLTLNPSAKDRQAIEQQMKDLESKIKP